MSKMRLSDREIERPFSFSTSPSRNPHNVDVRVERFTASPIPPPRALTYTGRQYIKGAGENAYVEMLQPQLIVGRMVRLMMDYRLPRNFEVDFYHDVESLQRGHRDGWLRRGTTFYWILRESGTWLFSPWDAPYTTSDGLASAQEFTAWYLVQPDRDTRLFIFHID